MWLTVAVGGEGDGIKVSLFLFLCWWCLPSLSSLFLSSTLPFPLLFLMVLTLPPSVFAFLHLLLSSFLLYEPLTLLHPFLVPPFRFLSSSLLPRLLPPVQSKVLVSVSVSSPDLFHVVLRYANWGGSNVLGRVSVLEDGWRYYCGNCKCWLRDTNSSSSSFFTRVQNGIAEKNNPTFYPSSSLLKVTCCSYSWSWEAKISHEFPASLRI